MSPDNDATDDLGLHDGASGRPTLFSVWMKRVLGNRFEEPSIEMVRKIVSLAAPTIVANVLWFLQQALAQSYVGRRGGDEALAQWAVGISIYNVAGLSLGIGLAAALDTLASQAYGRSITNPEIGELLQRSILVDIVISAPLVVLFQFSEPILRAVYGAELAAGAAAVLSASWLYLPMNIINNSIIKTVQGQNLPQLQLYGNVAGAAACWVASHFLIQDSVVQGITALSIGCAAQFVVLVVLCVWHPDCVLRHSVWPLHPKLLDWDAMKVYLSIGIPSLVSLCAEWWAFELLLVFAAWVSDMQVTILSVCLSVTGMCFSVALGVSVAGSVCIGNALGENKPQEAKTYFLVSMILGQIVTFGTVTTILIGRHAVPKLYTVDPEIVSIYSGIAMIIALFHWGDSVQFVLQGVFRGAGKQQPAAKAVLQSIWLVGVPMCGYLGVYHKMGASGILLGLVMGFCVEVPLLIRNLLTWNWEEMAMEASLSLDDVAHAERHPNGTLHEHTHATIGDEEEFAIITEDETAPLRSHVQ